MPQAPKQHRPPGWKPPARTHEQRRGSASERGYGWTWTKLSAAFIKRQFAEGIIHCAYCGQMLPSDRSGVHVDHKIAHSGPRDPLYLDESNWQMLHAHCHSRKTVLHDGGFGKKKRPV